MSEELEVEYPQHVGSAEELWASFIRARPEERSLARLHFAFDTNHHVRRIRDELEPFMNSVHASLQAAREERVEARAALEAALRSIGASFQPSPSPISPSAGYDVGDPHGNGVSPSLAGAPRGSGVIPATVGKQGL